jgi:trans-aconitate methyltransferase
MTREWDATSYHRLSDPQYGWGRRVLARISPRGDETVIDAGCGTARLTAELGILIPRGRVFAVDLSENMLRQAQAHAGTTAALSRARIDFICADIAALPFNSVADGIFSTAAFHWIGDHDALFCSLLAALKPGGWLIAQCGGGPNLLRLRQHTEIAMQSPEFSEFFRGWNPPQNYATAEQTAARLRHAGFSDVATWLHSEDVRFPDAAVYRDFLATVTLHAHTNRIPDLAVRARFLDRIVALAQQEPTLNLDYWRLNIHARKPY